MWKILRLILYLAFSVPAFAVLGAFATLDDVKLSVARIGNDGLSARHAQSQIGRPREHRLPAGCLELGARLPQRTLAKRFLRSEISRGTLNTPRKETEQKPVQQDIKNALSKAITESIPTIRDLSERFLEPHLVWSRSQQGGWQGECQERPSGIQVYTTAEKTVDGFAEEFGRLFYTCYPEYEGLVGFSFLGRMRLDQKPSTIPMRCISELHRRHCSYEIAAEAVAEIVDEFAEFVDKPTVRIRFCSQLLNFSTSIERFDLPDGLVVRRLSEQEANEIHGGSLWNVSFSTKTGYCPIDYVIEGEFDEPKMLGTDPDSDQPSSNPVKARLDKAMLAFRTFKEGRIGYNQLRFKAVTFCPWLMPSLWYNDLYVPFGQYVLSESDIPSFDAHAGLIFGVRDPAMEMACSRLADAETRLRPQDRAVDAVIGMESLLLAGLGKEERRGELSYRFSMRYSALFSTPQERYDAYKVARDLYSLRSTIAHGNLAGDQHRIGELKLTLDEAAKRATETLRHVIRHFLPEANDAPYKRSEFWDRALFGLPHPHRNRGEGKQI